jgi:hypothetical protein
MGLTNKTTMMTVSNSSAIWWCPLTARAKAQGIKTQGPSKCLHQK